MDQAESGYTRFKHFWIDYVLPRVSGTQWKCISVNLRHTEGFIDPSGPPGARRKEVHLDYGDWKRLTGAHSQAISVALKDLQARGLFGLRVKQVGRQRKFFWRTVPRANLKAVEPPSDHPQEPLPFASDFENQNPIGISEIKISTPASDFENQNLNGSVLISIKEKDLKKADLVPPYESEEFRSTLADFEQYRKEMRRPLTYTAKKRLYGQLAAMGEQQSIAALNQSMVSGWRGVFASFEQDQRPVHKKPQRGETIEERLRRTGAI